MKADEALEAAVSTWRTKHQIREDDPMLAALDLVRVYLAHAPLPARDAAELPPTFAEFRETVELLDHRANAFGKQSLDLIVELRKVIERRGARKELSFAVDESPTFGPAAMPRPRPLYFVASLGGA